jgi:uncharacterized RDD family membrane protein YckC
LYLDALPSIRMGAKSEVRQLYLATWSSRFWAWLIDVLIVGAIVSTFGDTFTPLPAPPNPAGNSFAMDVSFFGGFSSVALWLYWTALEGRWGQSVGKMVLDLRVVDREGGEIDYVSAAVESLGKAFVLVLDCLIGWLAMPEKKLRVFNRVSRTIVIEVEEDTTPPEDVEYVYPDE